ncbi:MAG: dihydrofolate reductase [Prevotella sp.]|nr:dihydrofolate reductase [Staphylococcus sp.]MCM1349594.1 dihydrofolate reductase [Prevotella sp.]
MIAMIVAVDDQFLIGNGNQLPWYEPDDLKYFKKVTLGNAVLMGYNTYLSIISRNHKALPKRINYVLTYEKELVGGGIIVEDLDQLLAKYQHTDEKLFIIGGKSVYESLLPKVEFLYLTRIHKTHSGDVYLSIPLSEFSIIQKEDVGHLSFEVYRRVKK